MAMFENKKPVHRFVDALKYLFLILFALTTLLPFLNLVAKGFSGESAVISGRVLFWPLDPTIKTYNYVLQGNTFFNAFKVSLLITLVGSVSAVVVTAMTAYPLSRSNFRGRKGFLYLWVFIMLFNGGMVPNYILVKELGLLNSRWALVLPYICNTWNMLIMRNFFYAIPDALEEAAYLDGANQFTILIRVILPLSLPSIATIAMFYAVSFWNAWFPGVMYLTDAKLVPVQNVMRTIIISATAALEDMGVTIDDVQQAPTSHTLKCASIVVTTLPILCVYPFIQKYFVKGVMVGSVKG